MLVDDLPKHLDVVGLDNQLSPFKLREVPVDIDDLNVMVRAPQWVGIGAA